METWAYYLHDGINFDMSNKFYDTLDTVEFWKIPLSDMEGLVTKNSINTGCITPEYSSKYNKNFYL